MQGDLSWQAGLRAICALEAIITLGHTDVCGKIAVHFQVRDAGGQASYCARALAAEILCMLASIS